VQQTRATQLATLLTWRQMTSSAKRKIYTVARLNQEVQRQLEGGFGTLWLQAELSNLSRPGSGHWYFSLKDSQAQIRCAMFRGRNRHVNFSPEAGDEVLVRGKLSLYAPRGDFQLIVEHMEAAGAGRLQAEFEKTRQRLQLDGWFDAERKQPLPHQPTRIGVVTSPTGAAIRDVLTVLKRRFPVASVIVYPTLVQGAEAAPKIAQAIALANERAETDVLLLVRGGGSIEDLWAFNDMPVAEAIRASHIPLVCGVGHEVDVTIADLVADQRAPTPSAAAEMVTPDREQLDENLLESITRLQRAWQISQARREQQSLQWRARLDNCHPQRRIEQRQQRVDEMERRVLQQAKRQLAQRQLALAWEHQQQQAENRLAIAARALNSVSPLATLERGYAIVQRDNEVISNASDLTPGDKIEARLAQGSVQATVDKSLLPTPLDAPKR